RTAPQPPVSTAAPAPGGAGSGIRPGDDFDRRGPSWADILRPHGWTLVRGTWEDGHVRRPGKDHSWSGTVGHCRREHGEPLFHCFTSGAPPFTEGQSYGRFRAFALLECNGDFPRAARELASRGYGTPATTRTRHVRQPEPTATDGGEPP